MGISFENYFGSLVQISTYQLLITYFVFVLLLRTLGIQAEGKYCTSKLTWQTHKILIVLSSKENFISLQVKNSEYCIKRRCLIAIYFQRPFTIRHWERTRKSEGMGIKMSDISFLCAMIKLISMSEIHK
jgi:hypothetical protein